MIDKTINNNFEQELIDDGYRFYKDNLYNSIRLIQKEFNDEVGVKYYISIYHYNFRRKFPNRTDVEDVDSYDCKCRYIIDKKGKHKSITVSFNAKFLPNKYNAITTKKEMENFFEGMFWYLKADYNEIY